MDPGLICLKFSGNWLRDVSNAVVNGKSILFEDVDETIDPGLDSILAKAVQWFLCRVFRLFLGF